MGLHERPDLHRAVAAFYSWRLIVAQVVNLRFDFATSQVALHMKIFANGILSGHVAFVTGGGTGITGGVARALAEAGANVTLVSRSIQHLEPAAKAINDEHAARAVRAGMPALPGEAFAVAADVRKPDEIARAISATVERFGKIDIVVNGAAGNFLAKAEDLSPNGFGTVVDIDLKGTFNVCRVAFEELKKNRGQILNISATLHYLGTPMQLHVSAAKAGVDALTRNLAVEWGRHGIRVNAIAPGPIGDTEGMKRLETQTTNSSGSLRNDSRHRKRRRLSLFRRS